MIQIRRIALIALLLAPSAALAQKWTPVGKTRDSTAIFVKTSSIKRGGDTVTVQVLARYSPANFIRQGQDTIRAVSMMATFDCPKERVKVTETIRYSNVDRNRIVSRTRPQIPGYQAVFGGSMPQVYAHVCPKKK